MEKINAHLGQEKYKTEIKSTTNSLIADEPLDLEGQDLGFSPKELLASALGSCTIITLKMYANLKGWNLTDVNIEVTFDWNNEEMKSVFTRKIELIGDLTEEQRERLLKIADKCPVHKVLMNPTEIETKLV